MAKGSDITCIQYGFPSPILPDSDFLGTIQITVDHKSITELGLSGFEVVDLTRKGVYDIVVGSIGYVASKSPALEGMDLAGAMPDVEDMKKSIDAYRSVVGREFETKYGVHLLAINAYPSQQFWCNKPVKKLDDLKARSADLRRYL